LPGGMEAIELTLMRRDAIEALRETDLLRRPWI
jgi:hypothetical protein